MTGNREYILKPTISITGTLNNPVVTGIVRADETVDPLSNALVSAQQVGQNGHTEVFTATRTADDDGDASVYQLSLPTGTYYIVAYKGGATNGDGMSAAYGPSCRVVDLTEMDAVYGETNFNLSLFQTGDITLNVILPATSEEGRSFATLRVMKTVPCSDSGDFVEVVSETVGEDGTYQISVPGSTTGIEYRVVASSQNAAARNLEHARFLVTFVPQMTSA